GGVMPPLLVKVTATDTHGESASQTFELTVGNAPDVDSSSDLEGEVTEPNPSYEYVTDSGQIVVDSTAATFSGSTHNEYGWFSVNRYTGEWHFLLGFGPAVQALGANDHQDVTFTVTIRDADTGLITTADVVITIHGTDEEINGTPYDDVGANALTGTN